jgi:hypothetical protein
MVSSTQCCCCTCRKCKTIYICCHGAPSGPRLLSPRTYGLTCTAAMSPESFPESTGLIPLLIYLFLHRGPEQGLHAAGSKAGLT